MRPSNPRTVAGSSLFRRLAGSIIAISGSPDRRRGRISLRSFARFSMWPTGSYGGSGPRRRRLLPTAILSMITAARDGPRKSHSSPCVAGTKRSDHWGFFDQDTRTHLSLCRAQELDPPSFLVPGPVKDSRQVEDGRGVSVIRWAGRAIAAWAKPRADLIAENLCLRQQLLVLERRTPRPRLRDRDRRFWILACRWIPRWRVPARRSAGHRAPLASTGMDGLLAVAIPATTEGRSASPAGCLPGVDSADVRRESPLGPTARPGRARPVGIPGVGPDRRQVHAPAL
jgi:hypothetical protein